MAHCLQSINRVVSNEDRNETEIELTPIYLNTLKIYEHGAEYRSSPFDGSVPAESQLVGFYRSCDEVLKCNSEPSYDRQPFPVGLCPHPVPVDVCVRLSIGRLEQFAQRAKSPGVIVRRFLPFYSL